MDEMNPAFENFLNNMSRLGGTPRETTRRVSPAKFLGNDSLATQVAINSRKITILKNTIQARRVSTGSMLTSLSDGSVRGVEKEIMDIKQTMISILETLKAQEKFEYEKFLDMQRREEDDKRKGRESFLERVKKKGIGIVKKGINKVVSPIRNIFSSILGFFTKLFLGRIMIKFLNFFSDPRNIGIVEGISNFIGTFFPVIVAGVVAATVGIAALAVKMLGLTNVLRAAAISLGLVSPLSALGGVGLTRAGRTPKMPKVPDLGIRKTASDFSSKFLFNIKRIPMSPVRIKFNEGGVVPGYDQGGEVDTVPAMLTPGEFVIKKDVVKGFGLPFFERLNKGFGGLKNFYNQGRNVRFPNENSARFRDLIKDDFSQITRTDKAFKEGAKGIRGARPLKAFTPNMMKTGPTPLFRQTLERPFRSLLGGGVKGAAKKVPILDLLLDLVFPKPLADGTLTGNQNNLSGNVYSPDLSPVPFNMAGESETSFGDALNLLNNQDNTDSSFDNELFDIDLNIPDINKMQTLGMVP